jgi:hypothetical protein
MSRFSYQTSRSRIEPPNLGKYPRFRGTGLPSKDCPHDPDQNQGCDGGGTNECDVDCTNGCHVNVTCYLDHSKSGSGSDSGNHHDHPSKPPHPTPSSSSHHGSHHTKHHKKHHKDELCDGECCQLMFWDGGSEHAFPEKISPRLCAMKVHGISGIRTYFDDSKITIDNLRDLSPFVVEIPNGGEEKSAYSTIQDAVAAAGTGCRQNILVHGGSYQVSGPLSSHNVIGISMNGKPSVKVELMGYTQFSTPIAGSSIEISWSGIIFLKESVNPDAIPFYLNNGTSCFYRCQFYEPFIFQNSGKAVFVECEFFAGDLIMFDNMTNLKFERCHFHIDLPYNDIVPPNFTIGLGETVEESSKTILHDCYFEISVNNEKRHNLFQVHANKAPKVIMLGCKIVTRIAYQEIRGNPKVFDYFSSVSGILEIDLRIDKTHLETIVETTRYDYPLIEGYTFPLPYLLLTTPFLHNFIHNLGGKITIDHSKLIGGELIRFYQSSLSDPFTWKTTFLEINIKESVIGDLHEAPELTGSSLDSQQLASVINIVNEPNEFIKFEMGITQCDIFNGSGYRNLNFIYYPPDPDVINTTPSDKTNKSPLFYFNFITVRPYFYIGNTILHRPLTPYSGFSHDQSLEIQEGMIPWLSGKTKDASDFATLFRYRYLIINNYDHLISPINLYDFNFIWTGGNFGGTNAFIGMTEGP